MKTYPSRQPGATVAGIFSLALCSAVLLCGAGLTPAGNVQTSDINANGYSITNAATVSAASFVGPLNGTATNVTGVVSVSHGGTGTNSPSLVAGANVTVSGTWPNQTITASGGAVYLAADAQGVLSPLATGAHITLGATVSYNLNSVITGAFSGAASVDTTSITTLAGNSVGTGAAGNAVISLTGTSNFSLPGLVSIRGGDNDGSGAGNPAGNATLKIYPSVGTPSLHIATIISGTDYDFGSGNNAGNATVEFDQWGTWAFTTLDLHTLTTITAQSSGDGAAAQLVVSDGGGSIASLDLSGLVSISGAGMSDGNTARLNIICSGLTGVSLSASPNFGDHTQVLFEWCALPSAQVNAVLSWLVTAYTAGGGSFSDVIINLSEGTSDAPTGTGITDADTLASFGCSVTTN